MTKNQFSIFLMDNAVKLLDGNCLICPFSEECSKTADNDQTACNIFISQQIVKLENV